MKVQINKTTVIQIDINELRLFVKQYLEKNEQTSGLFPADIVQVEIKNTGAWVTLTTKEDYKEP